MSTAQNTESTAPAMAATSEAFWTVIPATAGGTGVLITQRPFTASWYALPAEAGLAATRVTSNQGWFSRRERKRWPTIPVAPRTPTFSFFWLMGLRLGKRGA